MHEALGFIGFRGGVLGASLQGSVAYSLQLKP